MGGSFPQHSGPVLVAAALMLLATAVSGCLRPAEEEGRDIGEPEDLRQAMREFIINISAAAKAERPGFIIIPQNGQELLTDTGAGDGQPQTAYIAAIDGQAREDLFYGYQADDEPTPDEARAWILPTLDLAEAQGVEVLVTDYCWTREKVDHSYNASGARGYISFGADSRGLDTLPDYPAEPHNASTANVTRLAEARNFLYLLDPGGFDSKEDYLKNLANTSYDLLIIDAYYGDELLTTSDVDYLKQKGNGSGGQRLVIAYMSIGEAEEYRPYWQPDWKEDPPRWLAAENPDWSTNWKVRYWDPQWQRLIYGEPGSYLSLLLGAGFDGAYLDIVDGYEWFEG